MMKIGILALASVAFATTASAATSENPFARDKAVIQIQDLDLATTDGQRRLAIRMDQSARAVCGQDMAGVHLAAERKSQDCQAAVKSDIRRQIESRMASASTASARQFALAQ